MTFNEWWNSVEGWKSEGGNGFAKAMAAWEAAVGEEKRRRIYYQNIVYHVCNSLDRIFGKRTTRGEWIVCGTIDEPTGQVEAAMQIIEQRCTQWANWMAANQIPERPA